MSAFDRYSSQKCFPAIWSIRWRAKQITKNRTADQIEIAASAIDDWILETREQRLQENTEVFLRERAAHLFEHGGWELEFLPSHDEWHEPRLPASESEIRQLLESWPSWAPALDDFPVDDMADFDALADALCSGYPYDSIPGFRGATEAELYAVLAITKINFVERRLRFEEKTTKDGTLIHTGDHPWKIVDAIAAGALLVEAMEIICYAERHLSDAQFRKMRDDLQIKMEANIRQDARKEVGRAGAAAKLANDPKQAEKAAVRECWDLWRSRPDLYKSKSAFARDMLSKFEALESHRVIERWCKNWESEPS